jgi:outer membrane protein TolC
VRRRATILHIPLLALAALPPAPRAAEPLTLDAAVRAAWSRHAGLHAAARQAEAARAEADAASHAMLPTLGLSARGARTNEPLMAFGLKLDQGVVAMEDFDPRRLNDPAAVTAFGAGVTLTQPLYAGGRIGAGRRAASAQARAEEATLERRRQELALAVVEAYFGSAVAEEALRHADDLLAQARETESFVRSRQRQGIALEADVARAAAFRAQAEAERVAAAQRVASARSALVLLAGDDAAGAPLATPLAAGSAPPGGAAAPGERPDLRAARLRRDAADAGVSAARGALLPSVGGQASLETLRTSDLQDGASWWAVGVVARWELSLAEGDRLRAARARARAAAEALSWEERQARREVEEARRAVESADARARSAEEAVAASESARVLRHARHREGLLPLTDVLDAEAGLAGARALLLSGRLEARLARARLALATAAPVEGLTP